MSTSVLILSYFFNELCLFASLFFLRVGLPSTRNPAIRILFSVLNMSGRLKTNIFEDHRVTVYVISHRRKNAIELSRLFLKIYKISEVFFFFQEVFFFLVTWGVSLGDTFKCLARHASPANIFLRKKREKFRLIY